ncbi:MAG TPA: FtsX-like permease family protein, partial [Candidatus Limnocylindrales bacterium]
MGGLTSLAWRSLVARRGRTVLSIIAIGLGVGVLFASIATDAGIAASIDRTVREIVGRADLRVSAFRDRGLSPASVAAIAEAPGVTVAAPVLERRIYLEPEPLDPTPVPDGSLPDPVTLIAIDPELDAAIRDLPIAAGTGLAGYEEFAVLVTERLALEDGLSVGGDVSILAGADGPVPLRIAGLIEGDGPFVGSAGRTVIIPIQTAQRLLDEEGVSRVDIVVGEGASPDEVEDALEVALTSEPYVLSSPREVASALSVSTADFRSTAALIGAVALFVGAFLIFNTLSMTVVERVRELGLLRAAGTSRDQVSRFVLFQAAVLGVAGALLGLLIGYVLAELMAAYVRSIGAVPFERVDLDPGTALLAAGIGLFVTLAASIEPARRAGSISPVEALKARLDPVAARRARLRWLVGVFVAVGFAGLVVWPRDTGGAGLVRAIAVYGLLLLVVLLSPFLLASLARLAGLPFATFLRLEERLARAALARDRSRTALTVGALTVGLAMVVAVGGLSGQSRSAASTWLADVIPGDELVTSIRPIDLVAEADTVESLRDVKGVARVSPIALFEVAREGVRTDAAAVVGADLLHDGRLRIIGGDRDAALTAIDDGPATIMPRSLAERDGLSVGSEVVLAIGGERVVRLEIVGIAE